MEGRLLISTRASLSLRDMEEVVSQFWKQGGCFIWMRVTHLYPLSPQTVSALLGPAGILCVWSPRAAESLGIICHCRRFFGLGWALRPLLAPTILWTVLFRALLDEEQSSQLICLELSMTYCHIHVPPIHVCSWASGGQGNGIQEVPQVWYGQGWIPVVWDHHALA